ncbi:MAG: O-antigen ligase family protein [Verrucomicrobia bacterium]|nr:O-antigen ligase family protein [Verrucomicrobiota bacterium]
MEGFKESQMPGEAGHDRVEAASGPGGGRWRRPLRARDVQIYQACEVLTEVLIYLMVVFSPWAFGTTQSWSIWVMNSAGYCLGGMLAFKLAIRWLTSYRLPRWGAVVSNQWSVISGRGAEGGGRSFHFSFSPRLLVHILAWLTVAILGYCLISAISARATYDPGTLSFLYHDRFIRWLPHSFDSSRTWFVFWSYLGLACSFWAIRDWLLGKSAVEERAELKVNQRSGRGQVEFFPARLRRLFWLLAINGGLLGLEGVIQRLEGSGKLLFMVRPQIHKTADTQFGPYAYYTNASQYFNLLWPGCLGFWWMLHQTRGSRRSSHHLVLFCCAIMAACPVISTSRGGAIVTVGMLVLGTVFLTATHFLFAAPSVEDRKSRLITLGVLALFFVGALGLGFSLGWKALKPRMANIQIGLAGRELNYDRARPIAADYPVFGTGPGTFESVSQLYRRSSEVNWFVQLHNDWLETRITFGWVGSGLIALAFATVVLRWFAGGGIHGGRRFVMLMWLALGGCLVHARFDFPFQIHSIVFLFLILCAVLFNLSRR